MHYEWKNLIVILGRITSFSSAIMYLEEFIRKHRVQRGHLTICICIILTAMLTLASDVGI